MASIYRNKNGWAFRVSYKDGEKYRTKNESGFKTKRECQIAASEIESWISKGAKLKKAEQPFAKYFRNWYETFRKGKKSAYNDEEIDRAVRFAERSFPGIKIKDLDRETYQKALNAYAANHATASVRKHHMYMKACLRDALEEGIIFRDPTYKAITTGTVPEKREAMKFIKNFADVHRLSKELMDNLNPRYISRYMILFGLATGARFGEVLGMTRDCVDTKNGVVEINKTWDYHSAKDFGTTKTESSNRVITIDKVTCKVLEKLIAQQDKLWMKKGIRNKRGLLFVNPKLELVSGTAVNKTLRRLCNKLNITEITFHGLRHTHASILLYKGATINYVSKRLGHESVLTTNRVYTHILDELSQRDSTIANRAMESLFRAAN